MMDDTAHSLCALAIDMAFCEISNIFDHFYVG